MKRFLVVSILLLVYTGTVFAENGRIAYVDTERATARLTLLQTENEDAEVRIDGIEQEIATADAEIDEAQGTIDSIDPLIDDMNTVIAELTALSRSLADRVMKERADQTLAQSRATRSQLEARKRTLEQVISARQADIDAHRLSIRVLVARIENNENEIAYLEAAIARTEAQRERVDGVISDLQTLLDNAAGFADAQAEQAQ